MAFKRALAPTAPLSGDLATAAYVAIGMGLEAAPSPSPPNIEDTLWVASREGMEGGDARVLGLLVDWIAIHGDFINADRMTRLVGLQTSVRIRAFWTAIAQWRAKDPRFARLRALHKGPPVDFLPVGTDFGIARRGEDPRLAGSALRVPRGALRERPEDIMTPGELAQKHRGYYCRVLMGPSYRADMWALLEACPDLTSAELARRAYGSHATACEVRRDWLVLAGERGAA